VHKYFCPICKKEANYGSLACFIPISWGITARRLDLPYFLCTTCNLIGVDRKLIKDKINDLYQDRYNKKLHCYQSLYHAIVEWMQEVIEWRKKNFGAKEAKFIKESCK